MENRTPKKNDPISDRDSEAENDGEHDYIGNGMAPVVNFGTDKEETQKNYTHNKTLIDEELKISAINEK